MAPVLQARTAPFVWSVGGSAATFTTARIAHTPRLFCLCTVTRGSLRMASQEQHSQGLAPLLPAHPQSLAPNSFAPAYNNVPVAMDFSGREQQRGMQPPSGPNFFVPQPQSFTNTPQLAWSGKLYECWGAHSMLAASTATPTADGLSAGKGTDREWLVCCLTTYSFPFAFGCALLLVLSAYIRTVELTPLAGTP